MKNSKNIIAIFLMLGLLLGSNVYAATTYGYNHSAGTWTKLPKGYHESDDKSDFWIPKDVNPIMMTNSQLERYRIIKDTAKYSKDPFYRHYMQKAQKENRPFIVNDALYADSDAKKIYDYHGLADSLRDRNTGRGKLSQEQEVILKKLQDEYGEDSDIFDTEFRQLLKLYRQRQEYMKQNSTGTINQNTKQQYQNTLNNVLRLL